MSGAKQVGIVAAEIYFPRCFVSQSELEKHDGVSGIIRKTIFFILLKSLYNKSSGRQIKNLIEVKTESNLLKGCVSNRKN